jgi:Mg2+ and Co2+ transporter CorA
MNTLEHIHATLSESETLLWDLERMIEPHLSDAKKELYMGRFTRALNEVNTLRRRLGWYVTEMEQNLYSLGFDSHSSDHGKNFLAIQKRLLNYQAWAEKLMGVITSHVNLMETEKSILGFVFLPVSFVATFFSMGGDFAVGERRFWVFWIVAAVVAIVVCGVGFGKYWEMKWFGWRADRNERKKAC